MLATEAVVIIVIAKTMVRMPVAEPAQFDQLMAEPMMSVPAAETAPVNEFERSFGTAPTMAMEQWPDRDRRVRWHDRRRARGSRGERNGTECDTVQQHAVHRSENGHGSPYG
jgi:hypothetical protein